MSSSAVYGFDVDRDLIASLVNFVNGKEPKPPLSRFLHQQRADLRAMMRALADGRPIYIRRDTGRPTLTSASSRDRNGGGVILSPIEPWTIEPLPDVADYRSRKAWSSDLATANRYQFAFWRLLNSWSSPDSNTPSLLPCPECAGVIIHAGGKRRATCSERCEARAGRRKARRTR